MINRVILLGNLGEDPKVRTFEDGSNLVTFSLATNENYKDSRGEWQKRTEWHNVKCWRYVAEKALKLKKGETVYIDGKITTNKWKDNNGNNRSKVEIEALQLQSISSANPPDYQEDNENRRRVPQKQPLPF
jgi:single-strand DNA-binding protein